MSLCACSPTTPHQFRRTPAASTCIVHSNRPVGVLRPRASIGHRPRGLHLVLQSSVGVACAFRRCRNFAARTLLSTYLATLAPTVLVNLLRSPSLFLAFNHLYLHTLVLHTLHALLHTARGPYPAVRLSCSRLVLGRHTAKLLPCHAL